MLGSLVVSSYGRNCNWMVVETEMGEFGNSGIEEQAKAGMDNCSSRDKDEQPPGDERDTDEQPPADESVQEQEIVTFEDLRNLFCLLEDKDGGPVWQLMMDKSTPNITYQAWRRDPEIGPTQYRTRTIFEDVIPELVRDFFWDDDFRPKWDDMLIYFKTLEECPRTGSMISHWIRKLPFFCGDREYIIGRRIWESGRTYFCVTKAVPYPSLPRHNKPKRVDTYHSCWKIQAVESRKRDGRLTACEVIFFHQEDTGLPKELVKFGVRRGMWAQVKKLCHGLYAYQNEQMSGAPLSHCAFMARISMKVPASFFSNLANPIKIEDVAQVSSAQVSSTQASSAQVSSAQDSSNAQKGDRWKWAIVGGIIVLVCCLDKGALSKALIFGATRRLKNLRKKNDP
ncbi:hypothetical protein SUGI_0956210 [Cryptomeria japonica]|nr:hypothetical protein SUGI_0956210 [Cryptomeria japonica]